MEGMTSEPVIESWAEVKYSEGSTSTPTQTTIRFPHQKEGNLQNEELQTSLRQVYHHTDEPKNLSPNKKFYLK